MLISLVKYLLIQLLIDIGGLYFVGEAFENIQKFLAFLVNNIHVIANFEIPVECDSHVKICVFDTNELAEKLISKICISVNPR